jgi:hypothetical protein
MEENNEVSIHIDYAFQKVFANIVILNYYEFLELVQLNQKKKKIDSS